MEAFKIILTSIKLGNQFLNLICQIILIYQLIKIISIFCKNQIPYFVETFKIHFDTLILWNYFHKISYSQLIFKLHQIKMR